MHLLIKFLVAGDSQREDGAGPSCMTYSFVSVLNGSEILQESEKNTSIYFPRLLAQPTNTISAQKDIYSLSQQGLPVPKTAQLLKKNRNVNFLQNPTLPSVHLKWRETWKKPNSFNT